MEGLDGWGREERGRGEKGGGEERGEGGGEGKEGGRGKERGYGGGCLWGSFERVPRSNVEAAGEEERFGRGMRLPRLAGRRGLCFEFCKGRPAEE